MKVHKAELRGQRHFDDDDVPVKRRTDWSLVEVDSIDEAEGEEIGPSKPELNAPHADHAISEKGDKYFRGNAAEITRPRQRMYYVCIYLSENPNSMDVVRIGAAVEINGLQCEAPDGQSNETGGKVGKQCMSTYILPLESYGWWMYLANLPTKGREWCKVVIDRLM